MDENWLPEAAEIMWKFEETHTLRTVWKDFLLWAAYQAGHPYDRTMAEFVVENYQKDEVWEFGRLYNCVDRAVSENPHQNVLLKLAWTLHLVNYYAYNEKEAGEIFQHKLQNTNKIKKDLSEIELKRICQDLKLDGVTIYDKDVGHDSGSFYIAMANVMRRLFPTRYQEMAMFTIPQSGRDNTSSLMAFIQCSLMGMAGYVCTQRKYQINDQLSMDLFAPPGSICSTAFYLDAWNKGRQVAMNTIYLYGVPDIQ